MRQRELVGEVASQVPREVQAQHPQIPWSDVVGMRHRLIHGYADVDYDILWDAITGNLPPLIEDLEEILSSRGE